LIEQARAEHLDAVYNLIVNKEERVPDVAQFATKPLRKDNVLLMQAQEFHSSYWGHLGLLDLDDHFLTPDFSSYRESAFSGPYPHNGVIAALTHAQHGLVGYAHSFDGPVDRVIAGAAARSDYNSTQEKQNTLQYLSAARTVFQTRMGTALSKAVRQ